MAFASAADTFLRLDWRSMSCAAGAALLISALPASTPIAAAKPLIDGDNRPSDSKASSRVARLEMQLDRWSNRLRAARRSCDAYASRAKSGNTASLVQIANCYLTGKGRPKSILRAHVLFDRAAAQGSAEAHLILGLISLDGSILRVDPVTANRHFLAAAKMGNASPMIQYGLSRSDDRAGARTACDWYQRASRFANRRALRLLADCYALGRGRPLNAASANKLYVQAAALGDRIAQLKMTRHRFSGSGARMAERQGCDWTLRAAARGNIKAMTALASCLATNDAAQ